MFLLRSSTRPLNGGIRTLRHYASSTNLPPTIDHDAFEKYRLNSDKKITILDVRDPDELKEYGAIPNSVNIPSGDIEKAFTSMSKEEFHRTFNIDKPSTTDPIVLFCRTGKRAKKAQDNIALHGYSNTANYEGSFVDWIERKGHKE